MSLVDCNEFCANLHVHLDYYRIRMKWGILNLIHLHSGVRKNRLAFLFTDCSFGDGRWFAWTRVDTLFYTYYERCLECHPIFLWLAGEAKIRDYVTVLKQMKKFTDYVNSLYTDYTFISNKEGVLHIEVFESTCFYAKSIRATNCTQYLFSWWLSWPPVRDNCPNVPKSKEYHNTLRLIPR